MSEDSLTNFDLEAAFLQQVRPSCVVVDVRVLDIDKLPSEASGPT